MLKLADVREGLRECVDLVDALWEITVGLAEVARVEDEARALECDLESLDVGSESNLKLGSAMGVVVDGAMTTPLMVHVCVGSGHRRLGVICVGPLDDDNSPISVAENESGGGVANTSREEVGASETR